VDEIFRRGAIGLKFTSANQPRVLPAKQELVYFQVFPESAPEEWQNVRRTGSLAIRINEKRVVGTIADQESWIINTGSQTSKLEFTLFAIPPEKNK
jgi:hypothetical protein